MPKVALPDWQYLPDLAPNRPRKARHPLPHFFRAPMKRFQISTHGCKMSKDMLSDRVKLWSAPVWLDDSGKASRTNRGPGSMHATEILQKFLDDIGNAVMQERFEDYCAAIRLPLNILTVSASLNITTVEDLQDGFDDFTDMIQSRGISTMIRVVMDAWFETPDEIIGIYETNLMKSDAHAVPRFYSKMWLGRFEGAWQTTKIHNTINDSRWPILMTNIQPAQWPPKELLQ